MKLKIVYIIPTYNEAENIKEMLLVVEKILLKLSKYTFKILVVDDNSPDGTGEIVREVMKKHRNVALISGNKKGLGSAMIRGIKYAMEKLKADIVISNEADFSYNPKMVPFMIKKIEEGWDVVAASRRLKDVNKWPKSRKVIHFIANTFFAGVIAGVNQVTDHNSAFKAVRVKGILQKIKFTNFPKGFSFFNYFIFKLSLVTDKIYEFGTIFTPRTKGESKISLNPKYIRSFARDSLEYAKNCILIRIERNK